jgi:hypothetical protein
MAGSVPPGARERPGGAAPAREMPAKSAPRLELGISGWTGILLACLAGFFVSVFRLVYLSYDGGILAAIATGVGASYALIELQGRWEADKKGRPNRRSLLDGSAPKVNLAPSFEIYDPTRAEKEEKRFGPGGARP